MADKNEKSALDYVPTGIASRGLRVDTYIADESVDGDLAKRTDAALMQENDAALQEVDLIREGIESLDQTRRLVLHGLKYKYAEGQLKADLESDYRADTLAPEELKWRVLVYDKQGGEVKVSDDATLAVKMNDNVPALNSHGMYHTIHGYMSRATLEEARNALYMESVDQTNIDLLARVKGKYAPSQLEEMLKTPLLFEPKRNQEEE